MKQLISCLCVVLAACADLPRDPPPLAGMREPAEFLQEPDDEAARRELALGSFTGVVAGDARASLDALLGEPEGVLVKEVVENSPADFAGLVAGDVLLEARGRETLALRYPSEWRRIELESEPGSTLHVVYDRAGAEFEADLVLEKRVRPVERQVAQRFREEQRVGVVLRAATEVEARAAALGPGGGAVVVGLTVESPWRAAGIVYGDLVRAVDGVEVAHCQVLLDAIRNAPDDGELALEIVRGSELFEVTPHVSKRAQELTEFSIPLVFSYEHERGERSVSFLFGLIGWDSTPAAWQLRLLWLLKFRGGDTDRLEASE